MANSVLKLLQLYTKRCKKKCQKGVKKCKKVLESVKNQAMSDVQTMFVLLTAGDGNIGGLSLLFINCA